MSDSITLNLSSGSKAILKVGFILRATILLLPILFFGFLGMQTIKESVILGLIYFAVSIGAFVVLYNILQAAFFSEKLMVTKTDITIIYKSQGNIKKTLVNLNDIKYFGFSSQQYTKHTMDTNPIIDVTGLAVMEKELQYVIDEGNITIETAKKTIKFGKNMPSWDVEEVVEQIENFTGLKFKTPIQKSYEDSEETELPTPRRTKDTQGLKDTSYDDFVTEEGMLAGEAEIESTQNFISKIYEGDYGSLTIEQKLEIPGAEDKAFLNGKLAASGKYQVGDKQFVLISNGFIYAVRGFKEQS